MDQLTGILKKSVVEMQIAAWLSESRGGTVFLCQIDNLKRINEKYGHLAGDECLKEAVQILLYMRQPNDMIGRRSGNEFLIFMPKCGDEEQAQAMCRRIENRLKVGDGRGKTGISYSVTMAYAVWKMGDTCRSLLGRADDELEKRRASIYLLEGREEKRKDHYIKDVNRVQRDLRERIRKPGAYCPDYETFKGIYRFLSRSLIRSGQRACVILITVVDGEGRSLKPHEKDILMEELGENIGDTLRIGDVYARYSSSQYLVLVIDTIEKESDTIVGRIREKFLEMSRGNDMLIHRCYDLQPATVEEALIQPSERGWNHAAAKWS